jgi:hypothetical protein
MLIKDTLEEYVISTRQREDCSIGNIVREYGGADVLDELDATTALVAMPRYVALRLERDHPELLIEQNLPYKHFA